MKKSVFFILILLMVLPLMSQNRQKKRVQFFAPGSFYLFAGGALASANPDGYYYGSKETTLAPIFGAGCRVINFSNRIFLNVEFDFMQANYDGGYLYDDTRVRFYNYKLGCEFYSLRSKVAVFVNLGVTNMNYADLGNYYDDSELFMLLELGGRYHLSKNVSVRVDFRFFMEPEVDDYYDDYYYDYYDEDSRLVAFAAMVGLQLNL